MAQPQPADPAPIGSTRSSDERDITRLSPRRLGPYEVRGHLGAGGMGEVYLARDTRLGRDVAIKVLNAKLAARDDFARQLLGEAQAIARLSHQHIASVYDVLENEGRVCIVMEYLRGETLAERLSQGPLAFDAAVHLSRQVIQALDHAHSNGVVHCDLKPGNIFLTTENQAKILDFGLARRFALSQATTDVLGSSSASIPIGAGTPAYMSPEQRWGRSIDPRSDIYSFGIVLYEMVAGHLPALQPQVAPSSSTATMSIESIDLDRHVPEPLKPVIGRALASDPDERFQTAKDLYAALVGVAEHGHDSRSTSRPSLRLVAVFALLVVGVLTLVGLLAARMRGNGSASSSLPAQVVVVLPFDGRPRDSSTAYLAAGLTEVVADDLASTGGLVVSTASSRVSATSIDERSKLAAELGAGTMVMGDVEREADRLTVGIRLFTASTGSLSAEQTVSEPDENLARLQQSVGQVVRGQLRGVGIAPAALKVRSATIARQRLPSTLETFEAYQQARSFLERADVVANVDHALTILEQIVAREPGYALAHAAIAEANWKKWQLSKDPVWSERAFRSAVEALRLSPEDPAVRYSVALVYQGTGRPQEAIAELEQLVQLRPTSDDAFRLLGRLYGETGSLDRAMDALRRAIALRPGYWDNHSAMGLVAYRAGLYPEAIEAFQRFAALRPDSASAFQRLGTAQHAAGQVDAALQNYRRAVEIAPNANAYSNLGTLLYDQQKYEEAVTVYAKATELDPRSPSLQRNLGDAFLRIGELKSADNAYRQAVRLSREILTVNPKDANMLSLQALCLERIGESRAALDASTTATKLAPANSEILYRHAVVLASQGTSTEAVEFVKRALAAGYSLSRVRADEDLRSLRGLPAFAELVAESR